MEITQQQLQIVLATCITTGLTITSAPLLLVTGTAANNLCYGTSTDGLLKFNIGGGVPPYTIQTTGTTYRFSVL